MNNLIYVYCITRDSPSTSRLTGMEEGSPVCPFPVGSLVAIVSTLSEKRFSPSVLEKKLKEPAWLGEKVSLHESVVEAIMRQGPVAPLRFMTLFKTETSLLEALLPHEATFTSFLDHVVDKTEWALKMYLDKVQAGRYLSKICKDLMELAKKSSRSPGVRYLLEKRRERKAEEELQNLVRLVLEDVSRKLIGFSEDFKSLKPLDKGMTSISWDMLFNGAFLVANKTTKTFRKEVGSLARGYRKKGFIFQLRGPWPPYNFCPSLRKDESLELAKNWHE